MTDLFRPLDLRRQGVLRQPDGAAEGCVWAPSWNELSLVTLAIGLAGGLHSVWCFVLVIALVGLLAAWAWKRSILRPCDRWAQKTATEADHGGLRRWGLWLCLPFLACILLGGMLPPWDFDVREYHLQVPKEWYQEGNTDYMRLSPSGRNSDGALPVGVITPVATPVVTATPVMVEPLLPGP